MGAMKMLAFSPRLLVGFLFLQISLIYADGPVVSTKYGSLRGKYQKVKGIDRLVHTYLAVPFAKPPLGSLRLAPPQSAEEWKGERDARQQPHMCLQDLKGVEMLLTNFSIEFDVPEVSEDCLYLNIYTPAKPKEDAKLPVMVWIHGGGFVMGSASMFDGSALAAYENVVVVLVQYRLGILGFFSTGDEHAPGNIGLLDQVAALKWVQENIHSFGGDRESVTIFGESAGGISVSLQLLSPLSAGLFHRAIAESGTARMKMVLTSNPLPSAQLMANISGCDITSTKNMVDCMMQKTEEDILHIMQLTNTVSCGITVDGTFFIQSVEDAFQKHELHKVPFMTGVTNQEFGWLLGNYFAPAGWEEGMDLETVSSTLSVFSPALVDQSIIEMIADEYMGNSRDKTAIRDGWVEMMGDMAFVIPAIESANFHRDAGVPVYLYEFQHPPSLLQDKRPSFVKADHGDDIVFVFGMGFSEGHIHLKGTLTDEEMQLSRTLMSYFGNFARTGSPNGKNLVFWPQYRETEEYLKIGLQQSIGQHLKGNHFTFLTQTLPEKIRAQQEQRGHGEL